MENATPIPHDASEPAKAEAPRPGYETRDAPLRPIVTFAIAMFVSAIVIQLGVWGLMRYYEHRNAASDSTPSPFANDRTPPPEPRLQPSIAHNTLPYEDLLILRARWEKDLTTYGPVPGEPDRVRIPIARAMSLAIQRGLPGATTRPTTNPLSMTSRGGK